VAGGEDSSATTPWLRSAPRTPIHGAAPSWRPRGAAASRCSAALRRWRLRASAPCPWAPSGGTASTSSARWTLSWRRARRALRCAARCSRGS
jgi:hypothetical protein